MGILTLNILNSMYISISLVFLYKSCSVATPKYSLPLPLENYVHIAALAPNLRRVSFNRATGFLCHSSTIELLFLLILIKGFYPSFIVSILY
jgi:hypothetical protein